MNKFEKIFKEAREDKEDKNSLKAVGKYFTRTFENRKISFYINSAPEYKSYFHETDTADSLIKGIYNVFTRESAYYRKDKVDKKIEEVRKLLSALMTTGASSWDELEDDWRKCGEELEEKFNNL